MRRLCPLARLLAAHTGYLANYTASFWCTGSGSGSWQSVKEYSPQAASKAAPTIKSQLRELYKRLPRTTQLALGKLLAACGLDAALAGEVAGASQPLRDFLPEAAELLKQRENQQKGPRHQLAVMRSALRLGRQVTVGFVDSLRQQGADVQVALMEKLVAALDRLQHIDLDGINIIIGHGYGVDSTGAVRLTAKGSSSDWTGQLMQVDPGECRRKQVSMQNLHHLESAVAQAVGVSMIYTSTELAAQPAYTPFLQRLAYHATTEGAVRPLEAREVPLRIETGRGSSQVPSMSGQAGFGVDDVLGFITVPITATPTQVYQHIKWQAPKAQSILQHNRADAERSEGLRHSVERALRLRRLLRGPGVPTDGFRECCRRMLQNRDALGSLLEGTSVRIAHDNSVAPDGAHIDIAWNFVL
ncbi:hypothetical protein WJX72_009135 [[Myrmecia] bisecta]|uniref:DUF4461 domain-containing protein n=1 Tax=[Myrmecia] bisecta TaxID=41462 RepID=A0AAW1R8Y7_9CHLO